MTSKTTAEVHNDHSRWTFDDSLLTSRLLAFGHVRTEGVSLEKATAGANGNSGFGLDYCFLVRERVYLRTEVRTESEQVPALGLFERNLYPICG